ncbi:hypothetical protein FALBO_8218 [Fusarium albosuccineum]|uniref:Uncharacterized protein n=1 Tax=Fusarium albosuccineum TaxID=1237068 RepID=A0A8H4L9Z7_9HYPO|nr:hypothetical protein FALBO_8218 [Fusarium albosuccineum]
MEDSTNTKDSSSPVSLRRQYDGAADEATSTTSRSPSFCRDAQLSFLSDQNTSSYLISLEQEMKQEKERYPGASSWAPAEERLFEILFMRQDLPMLPTTWDVDLRGVPISDAIFQTSDEFPPIIYAHQKDFRATMALTRLIDLTAKTRTTIQSGLRSKVSHLIKREIDKYLNWAAQDGDYLHLRIVPNTMTEVIDTTMPEDEITKYIQNRMGSLAKLQREFLREDRNPQFWNVLKPSIIASPMIKVEPDDASPSLNSWPMPIKRRLDSHLHVDEHSLETPSRVIKVEPGLEKLHLLPSPGSIDVDELLQSHEEGRKDSKRKPPGKKTKNKTTKGKETATPPTQLANPTPAASPPRSPSPPSSLDEPRTPSQHTYRRHPPVVYGLFIINTSVLLLTTDSAKGPDAYVSYQVQVDFQDEHQSVWNALTIAIAVCLARDELRTRAGDFEELPCLEDSDPDA